MQLRCTGELTVLCGTVAFIAIRRFERVKLLHDPPSEPPVSELGFDPLTGMVPLHEFAATMRARSRSVKGSLLDQTFCAGVGNWIADEVLFQARVHPETCSASLSDSQVAALHQNLSYVVTTACNADAESDTFPAHWLFHFRWTGKQASKTADGHAISFATVASRTTAWVPALQKKTDAAIDRPPAQKNAAVKKDGIDGGNVEADGGNVEAGGGGVGTSVPGSHPKKGKSHPKKGKSRRGIPKQASAIAAPVEVGETRKNEKRTRTRDKKQGSNEEMEDKIEDAAAPVMGGEKGKRRRRVRSASRDAEVQGQVGVGTLPTSTKGRRRK
jgi:formamidopyrimidine-DNA glycosylase